MKQTWKKIDAWLAKHAPKARTNLRPPATPHALAKLQRSLGFPIPVGLRRWLLIHDGQPAGSLLGLLDGWIFLSAAQIAQAHRTFTAMLEAGEFANRPTRSLDGLAKDQWWSSRWVPFVEGPGGDYLVVDLDPAKSGDRGQVTTFLHDDGDREVKARSVAALMELFLNDLKEGVYEVDEDGGLWPE